MPKRPPLHVWLYGTRAAELTSRKPGEVVCAYTDEARDRWPLNTALLSCSLPLDSRRHTGAGTFFRGLLPEGATLAALASAAGVPSYDTFGMLARFGRDVAGAAVISSDPGDTHVGSVEVYRREALEADVAGIEEHPLAIYDDSEFSLPGLQNKLLLVRTRDGWARPVGGFPSTHILKVEDRRFPGMVTREAAALRLARHVGLSTVDATVETLAGVDCIIVSRYDRAAGHAVDLDGAAGSSHQSEGDESSVGTDFSDSSEPRDVREAGGPRPLRRLHQEDACQALGRDAESARGRGKYQEGGGPSFADIAELLDRFAGDPRRELQQLLAAATFTVVIGNADAHGKNLSLLHQEPGVVALAPLYDTVPTALWIQLRRDAAMTINGRCRLDQTEAADLVEEARRWRVPESDARRVVTETAEHILAAVSVEDCPEDLVELVRSRAGALLSGR